VSTTPAKAARTIWVVRHAEKASGAGMRDVELSPRGEARAAALPEVVPPASLCEILVTRYRRTAQTARAVAQVSGIVPTALPANDIEGIVERAHAVGGDVLIVGHCDTVPLILAALGVTERIELTLQDYGDVFRVELRDGAAPRLTCLRFGDA
jgi:phosphohistidine phosphatase SixA